MASIRTLFILKHQASKFHVQLAEKPAKIADLDISSMPTLTQNEIKGQTTLESTWNTSQHLQFSNLHPSFIYHRQRASLVRKWKGQTWHVIVVHIVCLHFVLFIYHSTRKWSDRSVTNHFSQRMTLIINIFHMSTNNGVLFYLLLHYNCTLQIPQEMYNIFTYIRNKTMCMQFVNMSSSHLKAFRQCSDAKSWQSCIRGHILTHQQRLKHWFLMMFGIMKCLCYNLLRDLMIA